MTVALTDFPSSVVMVKEPERALAEGLSAVVTVSVMFPSPS